MSLLNKNQEKEFRELFGPMMPSIQQLKKAGHIISFLTQFFALLQITLSNLPIGWKIVLYLVSFIIAFFISGIIEKGISNFLPFVIKQLLEWKFANNWFRAMFWMVTVFIVAPLVLASPTLSRIGGDEIIENLMTTTSRPNLDYLDEAYQLQVKVLDSIAIKSKTEIKSIYLPQKNVVTSKFKSKVQIQENKKLKNEKLLKKNPIEYSWANGHIQNAKNEIEALNFEMNEELAPILSEETKMINNIDSILLATKKYYLDEKDQDKATILSDWEKKENKRDSKAKLWGFLLGYFAVFGVICTIICIIIISIFEKGSGGIIEAEKQAKGSGNFLKKMGEEISGKLADLLPINRVVSETETDSETLDIGFKPSYMSETEPVSKPKKQPSETAKKPVVSKALGVSEKEVEQVLKTETILLKPEVSAQIKLKKRQIQSYQWKLTNKKGKPETSYRNIARLTKEINFLINMKLEG